VPPEKCSQRCSIARAFAAAEQLWREALSKVTIADLADGIDRDSSGTALGEVREWLSSH
jgi:DNA-binding IscR family transcriptional regulator